MPLIGKAGSQNITVVELFIIKVVFFEQHCEGVTAADVQHEVDVPAKDTGQFHGQVFRQARSLAGSKQGAFDGATGKSSFDLGR